MSENSVIGRQTQEVQGFCQQFKSNYLSGNSVKIRAGWGGLLESIHTARLSAVTADGDEVTGDNPQEKTFGAICSELGIPVRTAYHYISQYITVQTYPQAIQDAAAEVHLNLALPHVQAAFAAMENLPSKPNKLELAGIISQLQEAKPTKMPAQPRKSAQEQFREMLSKAIEFAKENKLDEPTVHETLESLIAASYGMPGAKVTREKAPIYRQGGNS